MTGARGLASFVEAALAACGGTPSSLRVRPPSAGAANHLFDVVYAGVPAVVKVRADPRDDAAREVFGLRALPPGLGPPLLCATTPRRLVALAMERGDTTAARALDVPVGGLVVTGLLQGLAPAAPLEDPALARTAIALRRLWATRRTARSADPSSLVGRTPSARARVAGRLLDEVEGARALDAATLRALRRALDTAAAQAARVVVRRRVALCHGDLRWHNLVDDGRTMRLVDLEHAGLGDPIADLLLFARRTPLSRHEEFALLEALLDPRLDAAPAWKASDVDAYAAERPLAAVFAAVAGLHDLVGVATGKRAAVVDGAAHARERAADVVADLVEVTRGQRRAAAPRLRLFDGAATMPDDAAPRRGSGRRSFDDDGRPTGSAAVPLARRADDASPKRGSGRRDTDDVVVAVDGTASSGKSVVARGLAAHLGVPHVNTGLAYRTATLLARERGWSSSSSDDMDALAAWLARTRLSFDDDACTCDGVRVAEPLFTWEIDVAVPDVARWPQVRAALRPSIIAAVAGGAVVEGRDVASALFPRAAALYVDAALAVRARRLVSRLGRPVSIPDARRALAARDRADRARAADPLVQVSRAVVVDTSTTGLDESIARALAALRKARRR